MKAALNLSISAGLLICCGQGAGAATGATDVWQWRNPLPQGNTLRSVSFGNRALVAVGDFGTVLSSTDGVAWAIEDSRTTADLAKIAFGNGLFVAVGKNGTVRTSRDGSRWEIQNSTTTNDLRAVAYVNGVFLAGGIRGTLLRSPGGTDWTRVDLGTNGLSARDFAYGNGTFVAAGSKGDPSYILTSANGTDWTPFLSLR
jgi:hypothetical protein